jgi:hypothetical protein
MKLTQEQIEKLYQFTRQHYVEWYDLQTELVDHLANAIEEQWQQNSNLTFEDALQIEFKKFGVFGFMDVVEKRQATLNRNYNKIVWTHFKEFFTIPKIILTFTLVFGLFYFFKYFYFEELLGITMFGIFLIVFPYLYLENKKIKKRKKETGKVWLFEQIIFGYGAFSSILIFPVHAVNLISNKSSSAPNNYVLFGISFIIVSIYVISFIIVKIIPSKAEQYLKETYPEYELAESL